MTSYTADAGVIPALQYPIEHTEEDACSWAINVTAGYVIEYVCLSFS